MSLFKLRPRGQATSLVYYKNSYFGRRLRAINSQTHVMGSPFQVRPSILYLFSSIITLIFIRLNPRYLPSTLLPSTSSTLQVALLSTLLTVATPIAQAVRTTARRGAVTGLLSQVERQPEVKSRRGWEKTSGL